MAFPNVDVGKVIAEVDAVIQANGTDADVLLRDGVTTFTVRMGKQTRTAVDLTDGISQERDRYKVMYDRWHAQAGAGREPEKGDQITFAGRRQAIESVNKVTFQGQDACYNIWMTG